MKKNLITDIGAISIEKASARSVSVFTSKIHFNRGAYLGIITTWPLDLCKELNKMFASETRRCAKNMKSSQLANLFQPASN